VGRKVNSLAKTLIHQIFISQSESEIQSTENKLRLIPSEDLGLITLSHDSHDGLRALAARYFIEYHRDPLETDEIIKKLGEDQSALVRLGVVIGLGESQHFDYLEAFCNDISISIREEVNGYLQEKIDP
jgi:hypothetical protein